MRLPLVPCLYASVGASVMYYQGFVNVLGCNSSNPFKISLVVVQYFFLKCYEIKVISKKNRFSITISTASFVATLPMQAKPPTGPDSLTDITKANIQIQ